MSMEVCKLCEKESTPWFHINGHICQDCYYRDRWISVKDDLPEHNQFILASDKKGSMMVVRCDIHQNGDIFIDYVFMMTDLKRQVIEISHWMPLPAPPTEELET